jgi:hypothetical protein
MKTFTGLTMFAASEFLFDAYAPPQSTNWSIVYFAACYTGMILISWDFIERYKKKFLGKLGMAFVALFSYFVYFELGCFNMQYDEYMRRVSDRLINNIGHILVIVIVFIIIYTAWERHDILKRFLHKLIPKK